MFSPEENKIGGLPERIPRLLKSSKQNIFIYIKSIIYKKIL